PQPPAPAGTPDPGASRGPAVTPGGTAVPWRPPGRAATPPADEGGGPGRFRPPERESPGRSRGSLCAWGDSSHGSNNGVGHLGGADGGGIVGIRLEVIG